MSKPVSIVQSHNVISVLANNVNWSALDGDILQRIIDNPRWAGENFTTFLKNGGKIIVGEQVITIDRSKPFNPAEFISKGWTIDEEDEHSLVLTQVNLADVRLEHMLKKDESRIKGEERLRRLKSTDYVRLDAKIFQTLWENQALIPEIWKQRTDGNTTFIFFDGSILRSPDGNRYVLYLCWNDDRWLWRCRWLERDWAVHDPSAVLASI